MQAAAVVDAGTRAQVRLRVPDIDLAMESREFEILQDAITHVCLAPVRPTPLCARPHAGLRASSGAGTG
jgi:hypothetical protein